MSGLGIFKSINLIGAVYSKIVCFVVRFARVWLITLLDYIKSNSRSLSSARSVDKRWTGEMRRKSICWTFTLWKELLHQH